MRVVGVSVLVFLNLVFLGMVAYLYLLWVQYWHYAQNNKLQPAAISAIYQNHKSDVFEVREIEVRPGKPRFYSRLRAQQQPVVLNFLPPSSPPPTTPSPLNLTTAAPTTREELLAALEKHKNAILVHFRRSQLTEGSPLTRANRKGKDYLVHYRGRKLSPGQQFDRDEFLCALRRSFLRTLRDGDEPFTSQGVAKYFPTTPLLGGRHFNTCVVVTNAASLKGSKLGNFIDSHDAVVRFNHAPTEGFEADVGSRTTLRIINSQVATQPKYDFRGSSLYSGPAVLVWDPALYNHTLTEWYKAPDFDVFPVYFHRRLMLPWEELHLLHPASLWALWEVLQRYSQQPLVPHPPSSGFLGMVVMLGQCKTVHVAEFVPSVRLSDTCHYWEGYRDAGCSLGAWHPLAAEKLAALAVNTASDYDTYVRGFVTIPGFQTLNCPSPASNPKSYWEQSQQLIKSLLT